MGVARRVRNRRPRPVWGVGFGEAVHPSCMCNIAVETQTMPLPARDWPAYGAFRVPVWVLPQHSVRKSARSGLESHDLWARPGVQGCSKSSRGLVRTRGVPGSAHLDPRSAPQRLRELKQDIYEPLAISTGRCTGDPERSTARKGAQCSMHFKPITITGESFRASHCTPSTAPEHAEEGPRDAIQTTDMSFTHREAVVRPQMTPRDVEKGPGDGGTGKLLRGLGGRRRGKG